ncbi:odorant receptor 22c [Bactrocera neohumeralis]|uniref:odorant receptor 22c n=1 Tax=Bactrocera tryoni TaxID=59916 RepID=UPI001A960B51|nr:odorant receptor 22c [Bactrocera tryoni]XP_050321988.1 odorant receptor 22c [Bactrocera neohumeralis]
MRRLLGPQVPIERSFFRIPRFSARVAGFWPQSTNRHRSWLTALRFCVNTFAVAVGGFGEVSYGFVYLHDLFSALEAFCPGITKVISLLKMTIFFGRHKRWQHVINSMHQLLLQDTSAEKRRIVEPLASFGSALSFVLLLSGSLTNTFFNILPLLKMGYYKWQSLEAELLLPFNVILPEMFVNWPYYPATYLVLTLSGAMTVFTFSAVDGFFLCACVYTSALFRMLQHDIRNAFAELQELEHSTLAQNMRIQHRLAVLVERHNKIIDLCSDFASEFSLIILMHFLSASLVLCFSILDLMLNSSSVGVLTYIFYSIAALTQLILYCIGGTYVSESSLKVAEVIYDTDWYKCDVRTRRMLLLMICRAQKAKTIQVPFFTPSLPAFRSIVSTAGSYITLLKTFL